MSRSAKTNKPAVGRAYALLLYAYPKDFRYEYGPQMTQVFRDCYRAEQRNKAVCGSLRFWLRTLVDVIQSAPKEHLDSLEREKSIMANLRRDAIALLGCIGIIVIALLLLEYGRKHEVAAILMFGYALDAVVTTGVIGNLIVFLLAKTTKLNPLRIALWTFLVVSAVPLIAIALIAGRSDPQFRLGPTVVGYVVSFLFWFGLHWIWAKAKSSGQWAVSSEQ
jgi:hypothetical protein